MWSGMAWYELKVEFPGVDILVDRERAPLTIIELDKIKKLEGG